MKLLTTILMLGLSLTMIGQINPVFTAQVINSRRDLNGGIQIRLKSNNGFTFDSLQVGDIYAVKSGIGIARFTITGKRTTGYRPGMDGTVTLSPLDGYVGEVPLSTPTASGYVYRELDNGLIPLEYLNQDYLNWTLMNENLKNINNSSSSGGVDSSIVRNDSVFVVSEGIEYFTGTLLESIPNYIYSNIKEKLWNWLFNDTISINIMMVGDSNFQTWDVPENLKKILHRKLGNGGYGFTPFITNEYLTVTNVGATNTNDYVYSPSGYSYQFSTGDSIRIAFLEIKKMDSLQVFYKQVVGGGKIELQYLVGASIVHRDTVDTNGGSTLGTAVGFKFSAITVDSIVLKTLTGTSNIFGIRPLFGTKGAVVDNFGHSGSSPNNQKNIDTTSLRTQLQFLSPDLIVFDLGTNGGTINDDIYPWLYRNSVDMGEIASKYRNAGIQDQIICSPSQKRNIPDSVFQKYENEYKVVADTTHSNLLSLFSLFGHVPFSIYEGLFNADTIHYSSKGSKFFAQTLYDIINVGFESSSKIESDTLNGGFTDKAVLFSDATGNVSQDPTDYYYDAVNNRMTISGTTQTLGIILIRNAITLDMRRFVNAKGISGEVMGFFNGTVGTTLSYGWISNGASTLADMSLNQFGLHIGQNVNAINTHKLIVRPESTSTLGSCLLQNKAGLNAFQVTQMGNILMDADSSFRYDIVNDILQLNKFGLGNKTAFGLSKTKSDYSALFATDGTVVENNISNGIYIPTATKNLSTDTIVTVYTHLYSRNDTVMNITGTLLVNTAAGTGETWVDLTLPPGFTSDFTDAINDVSGDVNCRPTSGTIVPNAAWPRVNTTSDKIQLHWVGDGNAAVRQEINFNINLRKK